MKVKNLILERFLMEPTLANVANCTKLPVKVSFQLAELIAELRRVIAVYSGEKNKLILAFSKNKLNLEGISPEETHKFMLKYNELHLLTQEVNLKKKVVIEKSDIPNCAKCIKCETARCDGLLSPNDIIAFEEIIKFV